MFENRYTGVIVVDVTEGMINGDPDNEGPRLTVGDIGRVSNHCIKRRVRDALDTLYDDVELYVRRGCNLTEVQLELKKSLNLPPVKSKGDAKAKAERENDNRLVAAMVEKFIDVRLFGAVVTQAKKGDGQVTGPVQFTDGFSVDPIRSVYMGLTCCAGSGENDEDDDKNRTKNMGGRWVIPYGLYVAHFDITPTACRNCECTEEDIERLFSAIERMYDLHQTSTSGEQVLRKFIVFKHSSKFGDQPRHQLYDAVKIHKTCEGEPRSFADYVIEIDEDAVNDDIEIQVRV